MKAPLQEVVAIEGVEAAYLFAPPARLLAAQQGSLPPQAFSAKGLEDLVRYIFEHGDISEALVAFPEWLLVFKVMDERLLLVVGNKGTNPIFLRMAMEVWEHRWKREGWGRVFPESRRALRGDETKGEILQGLGEASGKPKERGSPLRLLRKRRRK